MLGGALRIAGIFFVGLMAAGCASPMGSAGAIEPLSLQASTVSAVTSAIAPPADTMPNSQIAADVPAGFVSFCMRFPDQCKKPDDAPSTIALTSATWLTLEQVNKSVNRAIIPMDDKVHYGRAEYWNIPTDGYGDCEDYALTKRKALLDAGFSEPALRIALVLTRKQELHAVLTVTTDQGDYVLDNLRRDIVGWDQAGYQWIERQDPNKAWGWVALGKSTNSTFVASIAQGPIGAAD
jgi:predicted transglutaminase-like cysteine proteinase